jgi:hypothetical protein
MHFTSSLQKLKDEADATSIELIQEQRLRDWVASLGNGLSTLVVILY